MAIHSINSATSVAVAAKPADQNTDIKDKKSPALQVTWENQLDKDLFAIAGRTIVGTFQNAQLCVAKSYNEVSKACAPIFDIIKMCKTVDGEELDSFKDVENRFTKKPPVKVPTQDEVVDILVPAGAKLAGDILHDIARDYPQKH